MAFLLFFFNDTATTEIYTLSLHDALPISALLEAGMDLIETAPYLLHLLDIEPDRERFANLTPDVTKARIFETLRQLTMRKSRQAPLVIVVEDLHWIDSTSEEFLASIAEILTGARLLMV